MNPRPPLLEGLVIDSVTVRYGGVVAVSNVSLAAPLGWITGLLGPNGAGKTTLFNACNGILRPSHGAVRLFGEDVTRRGPEGRARRGLGRTFQRVDVCSAMTVRENVALGREALVVGGSPFRHLLPGRSHRRATEQLVDDALARCGLTEMAGELGNSLTTGQRRLVELARVVAGGYRVVLLDEPSSGLDDEETRAFGRILQSIVEGQGTGILLVEHDMTLVMEICQYLYVLDYGKMIFEGTPAEARVSEIVRSAYLGDAAVEESASSEMPA